MAKEIPHSALNARWELERAGLERLRDRWVRYSRALNLTGAKSAGEIEVHMREALAAVVAVETTFGGPLGAEQTWLDVGSGGGFPGLVVAQLSQCGLVLVEPRQRRSAFLESTLAWMGRGDARVVRGRIEDGNWSSNATEIGSVPPAGGYEVASARAVMAPSKWASAAGKWLSEGGTAVFHLQDGEPVPDGWVSRSEASEGGWVVKAARVARPS